MKKEAFPKSLRLKKETEIGEILSQGIKKETLHLQVYFLAKGKQNKFGILVTRQLKQPVWRNKAKRWLRELIRTNKSRFKTGQNVIFLVKSFDKTVSFEELKREFSSLIPDEE